MLAIKVHVKKYCLLVLLDAMEGRQSAADHQNDVEIVENNLHVTKEYNMDVFQL